MSRVIAASVEESHVLLQEKHGTIPIYCLSDTASREGVRHMYPDPAVGEQSLDIQQQALLREQERKIRLMKREEKHGKWAHTHAQIPPVVLFHSSFCCFPTDSVKQQLSHYPSVSVHQLSHYPSVGVHRMNKMHFIVAVEYSLQIVKLIVARPCFFFLSEEHTCILP